MDYTKMLEKKQKNNNNLEFTHFWPWNDYLQQQDYACLVPEINLIQFSLNIFT